MAEASIAGREARIVARNTAALAAAVAFCCWWSITFTRGPAGVSTLWAASGLLCGVLVTSPRQRWPAYLCAAFIASVGVNLWRGADPILATMLSMANALDAGIVAAIVAHYVVAVT